MTSNNHPSGGFSLGDVVKGIQEGKYKNIAFMVGAGISTSAGIPDFRSPDTGLYSNLKRYELPYPEAVFDISYFRKRPEVFYTLADELYPGKFEPTKFHKLMRIVNDKNLLRRLYTQNIDTLESIAGVEDDKIVAAHGSFAKNFCIDCDEEMAKEQFEQKMRAKPGQISVPRCAQCNGLVKPNIVFFGERVPEEYFKSVEEDFPDNVDLAVIAGTSLVVSPFNLLPIIVGEDVPRVLFNSEKVGDLGSRKKDVLVLGDCDTNAQIFLDLLKWDINEVESGITGQRYDDSSERVGTKNVNEPADSNASEEADTSSIEEAESNSSEKADTKDDSKDMESKGTGVEEITEILKDTSI